jgi:methyl-accepting chemotaxis protein
MAKKKETKNDIDYVIGLIDSANETLKSLSERVDTLSERIDLVGERSDIHSETVKELHKIVELIRGRMGV